MSIEELANLIESLDSQQQKKKRKKKKKKKIEPTNQQIPAKTTEDKVLQVKHLSKTLLKKMKQRIKKRKSQIKIMIFLQQNHIKIQT